MPQLRSGISGLIPDGELTPQEHEKKPDLEIDPAQSESDSDESELEIAASASQAAEKPKPTSDLEKQLEALNQSEKELVEHFLEGGTNFPEKCPELFARMANSAMGKIWAERLVRFHFPGLSSEEGPEPAAKRQKTGSAGQDNERKVLTELRYRLNSGELYLLTLEQAEKAQNDLGKALWRLAGPAMQFLHRFISTSLASKKPEGEPQGLFAKGDGLIAEMRVTLSLISRLQAERGPANGGLQLPSILLQHARSAMNAAWRILAALATTGAARNSLIAWKAVLSDAKMFYWHARAVFGSEFTLIIRAESWLADAEGPRTDSSTIGDRFSTLRDLLFPTDPAELGNPDAYEAYGLREIDAAELAALESASAEIRAPSPPDVLPLAKKPPGDKEENPQPDLWVQAQIRRMAQDEHLTVTGSQADYFMSHI